MTHQIHFDVTNLVARLTNRHPSGIERVDLQYGRFLSGEGSGLASGVHCAPIRPGILSIEGVRRLMRHVDAAWAAPPIEGEDPSVRSLLAWLTGEEEVRRFVSLRKRGVRSGERFSRFVGTAGSRLRLTAGLSFRAPPPSEGVYLNIGQHILHNRHYFEWLSQRPRLHKLFMLHDLLPLSCPEYFRAGYDEKFDRAVATVARHADALITQTKAVAKQLSRAMAARGRPGLPIHVLPLPSPLDASSLPPAGADPLSAHRYFVLVSTIEPRKNHLTILNLWRRLATTMKDPPRLVLVGARGWENEQVLDMLDRCEAIRPLVCEMQSVTEAGLARIVANARALLMPSFAEGYGLPVVEALALGTPVIASDIDVFAEIAGDRARLIDPLDGPAWERAIRAHDEGVDRVRTVEEGRTTTWEDYFHDFTRIVGTLS